MMLFIRTSPMLVALLAVAVIQNSIDVVKADDADAATATDDAAGSSSYANYYDGTDDGVCKVYDKNDFFTVLVQMALALAAVASLYFKRLSESPRRTFRTWFLDVSKQGFGACYAHVLNMMIASIISQNIRGDSAVLEDQCAWYGLSYLIDTTLGLLLAVIGLRWLDHVANERDWAHLKHSGVYAGDTAIAHWISQVMAWLLILTLTKVVIFAFMWFCSAPLAWVGGTLFAPFSGYKHFELLFVMIFFPGFLNVIYFWIADSYLKAASDQAEAHEHDESGLQDKKEALILTDVAEAEMKIHQPTAFSTAVPWSMFGTKAAATGATKQTQEEAQSASV